jgi:hypothetical protein
MIILVLLLFPFLFPLKIVFCNNIGIVYTLEIFIDEKVQAKKVDICNGQRPADAIADFLLAYGFHDNLVIDSTLYDVLIDKVCKDSKICDYEEPNILMFPSAKPYFAIVREKMDDLIVFLRVNQSLTSIVECLCIKINCSRQDKANIEIEIINVIQHSEDIQAHIELKKETEHFFSSNFYEVLGFKDNFASIKISEIRKAYIELAKKYHPDRNPTQKLWATEIFKNISLAYMVLSSTKLRFKYDIEQGYRENDNTSTIFEDFADEEIIDDFDIVINKSNFKNIFEKDTEEEDFLRNNNNKNNENFDNNDNDNNLYQNQNTQKKFKVEVIF